MKKILRYLVLSLSLMGTAAIVAPLTTSCAAGNAGSGGRDNDPDKNDTSTKKRDKDDPDRDG